VILAPRATKSTIRFGMIPGTFTLGRRFSKPARMSTLPVNVATRPATEIPAALSVITDQRSD
jgi:hypothetical protein